MPSKNVHLVVIHHGLWGAPEHNAYLAKTLAEQHSGTVSPNSKLTSSDSTGTAKFDAHDGEADHRLTRLVILNSASNRNDHTYDGIDWCGERLTKEIYTQVASIETEEGATVISVSLIGYSLGGLIVRFAIGLLYSQGFFSSESSRSSSSDSSSSTLVADSGIELKSRPKPASFTTFATPHIGIPPMNSGFAKLAAKVGSKMVGRSGMQLYMSDRGWCKEQLQHPSTQPGDSATSEGVCLLEAMSDPSSCFLKGLRDFQRIDIYANAIADVTVPFRTAAIEEHDPFTVKGGLILTRDKDHPELLSAYEATPKLPAKGTVLERIAGTLSPNNLPWLLNPQRFPLPFPLNYVAFLALPVLLPGLLGLVLLKLNSQTKESNLRVAELKRLWAIEQGELADSEIDEIATQKAKNKNNLLSKAELIRIERSRISRLLAQAEDEAEQIVRQVGEENVESDTSQHQPQASIAAEAPHSVRNTATVSRSSSYHLEADETPLSDSQLRIVKRLNALPQLKKHLAHFENIVNTHAVIIVRSPSIESHRRGMGVVKAFAERFEV